MASKYQLKNKIQTTSNIEQITKAMQMVASAKMRKTEETALRARPYTKKALNLLHNFLRYASLEKFKNLFFVSYPIQKICSRICLVVITSDKGLCGAFNSLVLKSASKFIEDNKEDSISILAIGKKGRTFFQRLGYNVVGEFSNFSEIASIHDIDKVADLIIEKFENKEFDKIFFCSMIFISALSQRPEINQILPLTLDGIKKIVDNIVPKTGKYSELWKQEKEEFDKIENSTQYLIEPSLESIFNILVLDLVKVEILHLIFESNASEHSARMLAMKNATDNAGNVIKILTNQLNKVRQGAITQELAEMASAKEALSD